MTFFDVLTLIGGLSLFLFGMNLMGDALEKRAGSGLKALLGKLTGSRLGGFLTGLGITAVIQSSSATTVMVSSASLVLFAARLSAAINPGEAKKRSEKSARPGNVLQATWG